MSSNVRICSILVGSQRVPNWYLACIAEVETELDKRLILSESWLRKAVTGISYVYNRSIRFLRICSCILKSRLKCSEKEVYHVFQLNSEYLYCIGNSTGVHVSKARYKYFRGKFQKKGKLKEKER